MSTFNTIDSIEWNHVSSYDTTKRNKFYTRNELINIAKQLDLKGYSTLIKSELAQLILKHKNNSSTIDLSSTTQFVIDSNPILTIPENSVYKIGDDCIRIVMLNLCDIDYQAYRSLAKVNKRFLNISNKLQINSYLWKVKILKSLPEMKQILDQTTIEIDTSKSNYGEIISTPFPERSKKPSGSYRNSIFDIWYRIFVLGVKYCSQTTEMREISSLTDLSQNDDQSFEQTNRIKQRWCSYWRRGAILPIHLIDFKEYMNGDNDNLTFIIKDYILPTLPNCLINYGIIKKIHIVNCGLKFIPNVIFEMKDLESLDFSKNPLITIPSDILGLHNLKQISLRDCSFTDFPKILTDLTEVTTLNFSYNKIKSIPSEIQKMKKLETLNLNKCNIFNLPNTLVTLDNLRCINLSGNRLTHNNKVISFILNYMPHRNIMIEI